MPSSIAFFPWVSIDDREEIGNTRLLPYRQGAAPGDLAHASQAAIDGVFKAYANRPRVAVTEATIVEVGDWHTGTDASKLAARLFLARNLIAFSALSRRRFFCGHFDYCNTDAFELVVQNYSPDRPDRFSFGTRRRDGGIQNMWAADSFAFHRPYHVAANLRMEFDRSLLVALLSLDPDDPVREFNATNTDSPAIPEHVELVMMKSAFEWLLQIDTNASAFTRALLSVVGEPADDQASAVPVSGDGRSAGRTPCVHWTLGRGNSAYSGVLRRTAWSAVRSSRFGARCLTSPSRPFCFRCW